MKTIKLILFYIIQFICGLPMSLIAYLATPILLILGYKPKKFGLSYYFEIGENWGGFEFGGACFLVDKNSSYETRCHEHGHMFQCLRLFWLTPFLVTIPSAIRYWLYEFDNQHQRYIYGLIIFLALILIAAIIAVISLYVNNLFLLIPSGLIFVYCLGIFIWLFGFEIPKFKNSNPEYDEIWFEKDASQKGEAFMGKYFPDNK